MAAPMFICNGWELPFSLQKNQTDNNHDSQDTGGDE